MPSTTSTDTLRAVPDRAAKIRADYAAALRAANNIDVKDRGVAARRRAIEQATTTARQALEALRTETTEAAEGARKVTAGGKGKGDDTGRLLAELELQRAWTRLVRQLDSGRRVDDLIDGAHRAGDVAALRALAAELPAWADSSHDTDAGLRAGVPSADDLSAALGRVDEALVEVLPDDEAAVLKSRRAADDVEPAATKALERTAASVDEWAELDPENPSPSSSLRKAWRYADVETDGEVGAGPRTGSTSTGGSGDVLAGDEVPHVGDDAA